MAAFCAIYTVNSLWLVLALLGSKKRTFFWGQMNAINDKLSYFYIAFDTFYEIVQHQLILARF